MILRGKDALNRADGNASLFGSLMIAAGIAMLVVSSAFFLGQGSVAGSEPPDQALTEPSTPDATLLLSTSTPAPVLADSQPASPLLPAASPTAVPPPTVAVQPTAPPVLPPTATPLPAPVRVVVPVQPTAVPPTSTPVPPPPTPTPPPPPALAPAVQLTAFESDIFTQQNAQRVAAGLPPLALDGSLVAVARMRSNDMVQKNYFAHVSPTGETAFILLDRYGIPYAWAGENLARNNYPDDQSVAVSMQDWMASEGHRENILNVHYTNVGVGSAVDASGMKYFTVVFTGP